MRLSLLEDKFSICRLSPIAQTPEWIDRNKFFSITRTDEELSIVCASERVPLDIKTETDWRIIKVEGPLDFGLTGILASIATPLAKAKISIFAISTFDTDYVLVKESSLVEAQKCLIEAGFSF